MSRRKTTVSTGGDSNGYAVGYGKPPKHTQFQPGESGNEKGRPKGVRNFMTDVKRTLGTPVKVTEGGRARTRSTQQGALMVLREKALRGDGRALDRLLELALCFNNDAAAIGPAQARSVDDQAILSANVAEITGAAKTPAAAKSLDDATSKPGASSDKKAAK